MRSQEPYYFQKLLSVMEELHQLKDLDALLDAVLLEARRLTGADAGSIYLVENGLLNFSFLHNDRLFSSARNKHIYSSQTLPLDNRSIAGYVACSGRPLVIEDVYEISKSQPFTFNHFFDEASGYRTKSLLVLPLKTSRDKIVGVMEIINALDQNGETIPFNERDQVIVGYFANNAAAALERAQLTRDEILRMIRMCELRDPKETGAHANRVGAYAAEIYHQWALNRGVSETEINKTRDLVRIAAMLHDLGKIAIPDRILQKPGRLEGNEFAIMKYHTVYGARLFENPHSDLDVMSAEIALNHHERWDGNGYPGKIRDLFADSVHFGPGKQGEEIPLIARIVALADVYDALVSKRVYKESLPEEEVQIMIQEQAGKQFDPEVVAAFFTIHEVIVAIRSKYQEASTSPDDGRTGP
ncbi:MAG: GAF and HD-GYP domain-containing protein [Desulfobaccales bacterium]